jgi:hypothetical protein
MRETTRGRAWTSLVLGILIFLVPFLASATPRLGFGTFAYNDYAVGVVVVVLAAICVWAAKKSLMTLAWLEGINALAGLYAIVTPFVVATPTNAMYSNVLLGLILVVVAGWDAYVGMTSSGGRTMTRRGRAV